MAKQLKVKSNDLWKYFFPNIHNVLKDRFKHNIRTDGVSVSIYVENWKKPKPKEEPKQRKKKITETKSKDIPLEDKETRLICIDPGIRSLITGIVVGQGKRCEVVKMSDGEYHHIRKTKKFN